MAGYIGDIPVPQATQTRQTFTATASQTSFPTIGYTAGFIDVYLNGVKLLDTVDYAATNGSDVVLTTGAALNDILEVTIFDTFTTSSGTTTNTTHTSATLKSNVTLKNDTEEDSDGGRASKIIYQGEQSGGEITTLAEIQASHDGSADDQKGDLIFRTNDGSDGTSPTEAMRIDAEQNLGLGTNAPAHRLDIVESADAFGARITNNSDGSQGLQVRTSDNDTGQFILDLQSSTSATGTDYGSHFIVDKSGKCGIGTTAPLRQLHIHNTSANSEIAFTAATNGVSSILFGDGQTGIDVYRGYVQYNHADDDLLLATASAERIRIDSVGDILTDGVTSINSVNGSTNSACIAVGANYKFFSSRNSTTSRGHMAIWNPNGLVGSINTSGSATSYNTSSDYRLKENVADITDGITRVKQLKPSRFNFIADADKTVDGFLAHEAATVVPEAITGTKDELQVWQDDEELPDGVSVGDNKLDKDGNTIPLMQQIDQAKLVPLLTAALKEAIAKIETLETKVAALEAE